MSNNYTPIFPEIAAEYGLTTAAVYGVVWRYCQMRDAACHGSYETLAAEIGVHGNTVATHVEILRDARYLAVMVSPDSRTNWIVLGEKTITGDVAVTPDHHKRSVGTPTRDVVATPTRDVDKETKDLRKPVKKPGNASHSRKRKGRPFWNDDQKVLADHFSEVSGLPIPKLEGRAFAQVTKSWKLPLSQMFELVGSVTDARKLIAQTVREMRADKLTISAPRSIWNVALSIHARGPTNGAPEPEGFAAIREVYGE